MPYPRSMSGNELPDLSAFDREMLLDALARRAGTGAELAKQYGCSVVALRAFVQANHAELTDRRAEALSEAQDGPQEALDTVTPTQLDDLWLSKKFERLKRYQEVANFLYKDMTTGHGLSGSDLSTAAREFRSYAMLAANELGQLLNRGAGDTGDGDSLAIDVGGINISDLR